MKAMRNPAEQAWASPAKSRGCNLLTVLMAAYAALLPYQIQMTPEIRFAPADVALLLGVALVPAQLRYRPTAWSFWHVALPLVFATSLLLTAFGSGGVSQYAFLNKFVGLLLLCLTYLAITSAVTDWRALRWILLAFMASAVLQNIVAIVAYGYSHSAGADSAWTSYDGRRLSGLLIDPNAYGGLLVLTLALTEGAAVGPSPLLKGWLLDLSRVTLMCGIVLTFSRTAWLSLAVLAVGLCLLRPRLIGPWLLCALVAAGALGLLAGDDFAPFFADMAHRPEQARGRFELVASALDHFEINPLLGGGVNDFRAMEGTVVHNTPLWFLTDFGLLGFAVFGGFVAWFFVKGISARRFSPLAEKPVVLGLILGHAAMLALAMGIEAFYQRHWWMVMALIAASQALALRPVLVASAKCRPHRPGGIRVPAAGARAMPGLAGPPASGSSPMPGEAR